MQDALNRLRALMGSSDGPVVLTREVALDLIQKIEALQLRCTREIPLVGKRVRLLSATRTNGGKEFVAGEVLEVTEHMGLTRAPHSSYLSINLQDPSDNQRQVTLTDTALTGDGRPVVEVISD